MALVARLVEKPIAMKAAAVILLASSTAFAQAPGDTAPAPMFASASAPEPGRLIQTSEKDPTTAVLLSLGTTLAGVAIIGAAADENESLTMLGVGALFFGPSTGHWYAGRYGGYGMAARAASAGLMVYGLMSMFEAHCDLGCNDNGQQHDAERRGATAMVVGAIGWVGATVYDIVTAPEAVRDYNRAHQMTIAPTVIPSGGAYLPGVAVSARF